MLSSKAKLSVVIILTVISMYLIYMLWNIQQRLPIIEQVDDIHFESVLNEDYTFQNEHLKVVAFIYTKCPDICPMTMYDLTFLQAKLKDEQIFGDRVQIVTITLDPEFDTADTLRKYASNFAIDSSGWFILRDSESETKIVANQFQMNYKKDENGFVTHSTKLYLVDAENKIRSVHDMNVAGKEVNLEEIMENIERLLDE
ncbi:SCO family protein [Bacillus luteolus]|uniref:SCO family protein n=1 Tax=Litchfieldia luteola TaxID=682179 RepID=A0ABR9QLP6_9BACI|nr:SCO family protein [Cytobacillus luteolus]MBE4909409.1 SCO family protein [Cytobacillus luteolus]MBP1940808.1 protein SCO1/2 [Cytobacillus luteolus]